MAILLKTDTTANDSSKTWTVPTGKKWRLLWAHVELTSTATAGNRQMVLSVTDADDDVLYDTHAGNVQAASNTYHYEFAQGVYRETTVTANSLQCPIANDMYILPGWKLLIEDSAAVAAAADDMVVHFCVEETPAS